MEEKFIKKELLMQAEDVIRETISLYQSEDALDATRFLGLFATAYAFNLLAREVASSYEIDGIFKLSFSIKHLLSLTNRNAVDLLYKVAYDVYSRYAEKEAFEFLNGVESLNKEIQEIVKEIYPDLDSIYFTTTNPEGMRDIAMPRINAYIKSWHDE